MIDHEARAAARQAVDDFLSERIGSFAFDDKLLDIARKTQDRTVWYAASKFWHIYSDVEDHLVRLDKRNWDTMQRLLLVLDSGAELREERKWIWHPSQLVAAAALIVIGCFFWINKADNWFIPLSLGGVTSMALCLIRRRVHASYAPSDPWRAWPFPTVSSLARAMDRTPVFRKQRHRPEIARRRSSRFSVSLPEFVAWPLSRIGWCFVSPIILMFQCLPLLTFKEEFAEPHNYAVASA